MSAHQSPTESHGQPRSQCNSALPGYSPELNPDEQVWNHLKTHRVSRTSAHDAEDLKAKAQSALRSLQKLPHLVRGFFYHPDCRYAAA